MSDLIEKNNELLHSNSIFIATGCACRSNVVDICLNTFTIIFASENDFCIAGLDEKKLYYRILGTYFAHPNGITSVKLSTTEKTAASNLFCTASNDGEFAVWHITYNKERREKVTLIHRGKRDSPLSLAKICMLFKDGSNFLVSTSEFDKILLECFRRNLQTNEIQSNELSRFEFPGRIILSHDFAEFNGLLLIAIGLSNGIVEFFYSRRDKFSTFVSAISLTIEQNVWIRSLAFKESENGLLLATSADNLIKLWSLNEWNEQPKNSEENGFKMTPRLFTANFDNFSKKISIKLESILTDHDGFIQTINWHPNKCDEFLTSGSDKKVIRWQYSPEQSLWLPVSRMGEVGEEHVDYFDATYLPDGNSIIYHSLFGAFYIWEIIGDELIPKSHTISGHFDAVTSISWDPTGSYLLSCGADKTTRIYTSNENNLYFEIARPQIHGHSLNCLASISSILFVSGAEEKIFRIFQANSSFAKNLNHFAKVDIGNEYLPECAYQNELELTNKPKNKREEEENLQGNIFDEPPREDELSRLTLFPEIQKLYGHGYEVWAIASNHKGTVIVTACKASHPEHANIILWDTKEWQQRKSLEAHQLTVTQMAFSKNDKYLLSTSRDRTWTLFSLTKNNTALPFDYSIYYKTCQKSSRHGRIIWACAWSWDSKLFATASRDKILNIWGLDTDEDEELCAEDNVRMVTNFTANESITAVDFAPMNLNDGSYLNAIGLENGKITILKMCLGNQKCQIIYEFSRDFAHSGSITAIRFRPKIVLVNDAVEKEKQCFELASSSTNHIVKIYRFYLFHFE